eukprot:COSAG02_NODE_70962_length_193_cov_20.382979_1_plen_31_part_10
MGGGEEVNCWTAMVFGRGATDEMGMGPTEAK